MTDWRIFQGTGVPSFNIENLPSPPPWRQFSRGNMTRHRGSTFSIGPEAIDLINAALYLRRPLLVTGKPGTGKSSLAYAVAYELQLGEVLYWPITTRTILKDGLYSYDAIGRLQDMQLRANSESLSEIGQYIRLGALGTALLPSSKPRVLLIDDFDNSDIDLPNDLMHIFEEGRFEIPELARVRQIASNVVVQTAYRDQMEVTFQDETTIIQDGQIYCSEFPFVILTSNGERDFPPQFLRSCIRLLMKEPSAEELARIVASHLGETVAQQAEELIHSFLGRRYTGSGELATDQLLNAVFLLTHTQAPEKQFLIDNLLKSLSSMEDV